MQLNSQPWWDSIAAEWLRNGDMRDDADNALTARCVGSPVLEVGCAFGQWARKLHHLRPDVQYVGIDLAQALVSTAVLRNPGLVFLRADVMQLPAGWHKCFDTVTAFQTLEHFADPGPVLNRLAQLARRRLVFSVPRGLPGPDSRKHNGHVTGWADEADLTAYLSAWGAVTMLNGRREHLVGYVDWQQEHKA